MQLKKNFYSGNCSIYAKIKGTSPLYVLKMVLQFKNTYEYVSFDFVPLPVKTKEIVVLKSPFIYKQSRLKFNFKIHSGLLFVRFLNLKNSLINLFLFNFFFSNKNTKVFSLCYSIKKKFFGYFF